MTDFVTTPDPGDVRVVVEHSRATGRVLVFAARRDAERDAARMAYVAADDLLPLAEAVLGEPVLTRTQLSALLGSDDRDVMTNADLREHVVREVVVCRSELPPPPQGMCARSTAEDAEREAAQHRTSALAYLAAAVEVERLERERVENDRLVRAAAARDARLARGRRAYDSWLASSDVGHQLPRWPALNVADRERWAAVADAVADPGADDLPF